MNHNRAHAVPLRLVDGGLVNVQRDDLVRRMADDLVKYDAVHNKQDSVRCLMGLRNPMGGPRYRNVDIAFLQDDVRQAAFQILVAAEMAEA
jgi:hypothetical protein